MSRVMVGKGTLSGLVSDSEDDQFAMPSPKSSVENHMPAKKGRGRPKTAPMKVTKSKAPARRTSGRVNVKTNVPAAKKKGGRPALADKTNQQVEEVDEFAQEDDVVMHDVEIEDTIIATKPAKSKPTRKKAPSKKEKAVKEAVCEDSDDEPAPEKPKARPGRKKAVPEQQPDEVEPSPEKIVLESQVPIMMEVDSSINEAVEEVVTRTAPHLSHARSESRIRPASVQRRRAGSVSDTEGRGDPVLRRKLGDITNKYENLHIRYQDLRERGFKEAERNYEHLLHQGETEKKRSTALIAELKADVIAQRSLAKESKSLKKKLDTQVIEIAKLQAQVAQLNTSLAETKAENKTLELDKKALMTDKHALTADNKTLSAKLAANRTAAASIESATVQKVPGSAVKPAGGIRMMGSVEAAQTAQAAQLKENLFGDLTGLIIRDVKREKDEDIFDCIQTGRNGTLHFKLDVANEVDLYDAQCNYVPLLDPSRDKDMIDLLPDYLVDEITFPKSQAPRFYARVMKALTEKVVD